LICRACKLRLLQRHDKTRTESRQLLADSSFVAPVLYFYFFCLYSTLPRQLATALVWKLLKIDTRTPHSPRPRSLAWHLRFSRWPSPGASWLLCSRRFFSCLAVTVHCTSPICVGRGGNERHMCVSRHICSFLFLRLPADSCLGDACAS